MTILHAESNQIQSLYTIQETKFNKGKYFNLFFSFLIVESSDFPSILLRLVFTYMWLSKFNNTVWCVKC